MSDAELLQNECMAYSISKTKASQNDKHFHSQPHPSAFALLPP